MTTARELIEYLSTLPPDTEIEVLEAYRAHYDTITRWEPLELGPYSNTMDLIRFDRVAESHPYHGKTVLFLGES